MALRIKEIRKAKGMTQSALADMAGMTPSHLSMIENGSRPANTYRLQAIASALGVSEDELFHQKTDEQAIVAAFRLLSEQDKDAVLRMAEALARQTQSGVE